MSLITTDSLFVATVGYSQTMPRGISLSGCSQDSALGSSVNTKSSQQRSVSPDLVSKRQLKEQVGE